MIITEKYIDNLRNNFMTVTKEQEKTILELFSAEHANHYEWSEQDIWEQTRKIIGC
jgi:hypothetical protein